MSSTSPKKDDARKGIRKLAYDLFLALVPPFALAVILHFGLGIG